MGRGVGRRGKRMGEKGKVEMSKRPGARGKKQGDPRNSCFGRY
jgi:hypothetical protein